MADYKWNTAEQTDGVVRYSDGASIPNADGNKDWQEYLEYSAGGGITDPWRTGSEAENEAYETEIQWGTDQLIKCDKILVFDNTQDMIGNSTLSNQTKNAVTTYAQELDVYVLAVQGEGVGGVFPARPMYDGGEAPTIRELFYP